MNDLTRRQPVHVVYGGAQLFKARTVKKIGELARKSLNDYAYNFGTFAKIFELPENEISNEVYERVRKKLETEPVEDYRIDFEDGFGYRTDEEEDEAAIRCAGASAEAMHAKQLPDFFGIRVKAYNDENPLRPFRTLSLYLRELLALTSGILPENFAVTFPKVSSVEESAAIAKELAELEKQLGIGEGILKMEIMVETAGALINRNGRIALPMIVNAAEGRVAAAHFGAFDYLAELGVTAKYQELRHQSCDFARNIMKVSLCGTGIRLSDGATNIMPVAPRKGENLSDEQKEENTHAVRNAWKLHFDNVTHSLRNGFYQGWDLHPAQLIPRYAATYLFFLMNLSESTERLKNFLSQAARSAMHENIFDDAASGQGLLNFFRTAYNCGAVSRHEVESAGITVDELKIRTFSGILNSRKKHK